MSTISAELDLGCSYDELAERLEAEKKASKHSSFDDGVPVRTIEQWDGQWEKHLDQQTERHHAAILERAREAGDPDCVMVECLEVPKLGVLTLRVAAERANWTVNLFLKHVRKGQLILGKRWVEEGKAWKPGPPVRPGTRVTCVERPELSFPNLCIAAAWLGLSATATRNAVTEGHRAGGYHWRSARADAHKVALKEAAKVSQIIDRKTGRIFDGLAQLVTEILHEDPEMASLAFWKPEAVRERRKEVHREMLTAIRSISPRWAYVNKPGWMRNCYNPAQNNPRYLPTQPRYGSRPQRVA